MTLASLVAYPLKHYHINILNFLAYRLHVKCFHVTRPIYSITVKYAYGSPVLLIRNLIALHFTLHLCYYYMLHLHFLHSHDVNCVPLCICFPLVRFTLALSGVFFGGGGGCLSTYSCI